MANRAGGARRFWTGGRGCATSIGMRDKKIPPATAETRTAGARSGAGRQETRIRAGRTMDSILVRGGRRLSGAIPISGAKNACLTLMPAALLTDEPITLTNAPRLSDIRTMTQL